ncbi:hypothetical protein V8E53_003839 [Lactarius tabidus]
MLAAQARVVLRALATTRGLSTTAHILSKGHTPPLPKEDLSLSPSAEEAVINTLYNTPPPSWQLYKRTSPLCYRACLGSSQAADSIFNIDSLVVQPIEIRDLSSMCIVIIGQDRVVEQARWQLEEFRWTLREMPTIPSRLLLVKKVSLPVPDYLEIQ